MSGPSTPHWTVEITHDGMWPTTWCWHVDRRTDFPYGYEFRRGYAVTKERARRKALRAKQSMETEDVKVEYPT